MTEVISNARLELLRSEAETRDMLAVAISLGHLRKDHSGWHPLHEDLCVNNADDIRLAARECAALGHIELHIDDEGDYACRATDAGYDWIRAYDVLGEAMQGSAP